MVATAPALRAPALDVERIRQDFPILGREVHGVPLVYLDSAATAQKPTVVLDALDEFSRRRNANVHRGVHTLAEEATAAYEAARATVARFVNAADPAEVVFTRSATDAINLVAYALSNASHQPAGSPFATYAIGPGDEICVTEMEHHSNLVPWQLLCDRTGATLRWLPITDAGRLDLTDLETLVNERTRLLAFTAQSNLLGTVTSESPLVQRARQVGALVLVDAAQLAPHRGVDVQDLGADLVVITGHKLCGPTGIGALWGRRAVLEQLPPVQGGGEMVLSVTMTGATYAPVPLRFEAGTPPIAQAVGLAAACDYLAGIGMDAIRAHERDLTAHALERLDEVPGLRLIGPATVISRGGTLSFVLDGIHAHDVGQLLDAHGVAVRVGHHCAKPVCDRLGVAAVTRASFHLYTTFAEVDALVDGLLTVGRYFR